jgi:hypothetical protein
MLYRVCDVKKYYVFDWYNQICKIAFGFVDEKIKVLKRNTEADLLSLFLTFLLFIRHKIVHFGP